MTLKDLLNAIHQVYTPAFWRGTWQFPTRMMTMPIEVLDEGKTMLIGRIVLKDGDSDKPRLQLHLTQEAS